jgi:LysM repeat protein
MELALLDERLQKPVKQEGLDKRLSALEKKLEAVATDLRALSGRLNQTLNQLSSLETSMAECDGRLSEVSKLKGTLTSLSQAMQTPQKSGGESTYLVKSGDSLEKIARAHHMTVNALRQLNQLSSDTIRVGQRLKVSDG